MNRGKVKRRRGIAVTIRMDENEYALLQDKVRESGLTQQAYIINAIKETPIVPFEEIIVQKEVSKSFAELVRQLRGLATNVNQMARVANGAGYLPAEKVLEETAEQISEYRRKSEMIWQLIRSSIEKHHHTAQ